MQGHEDFENLMIEYGQMPGGVTLKELYNLNLIKGEEKKEKRTSLLNLSQMWSWA